MSHYTRLDPFNEQDLVELHYLELNYSSLVVAAKDLKDFIDIMAIFIIKEAVEY